MKSIAFSLLLSLFFIQSYGQCVIEHWTLDQRVDRSTLVVEAKVIDQKSTWDAEHKNIYTINTLEVYRRFKGLEESKEIELVTMGGTVGLERHEANPSLQLSNGDVGIFLLISNTLKFNNKDKMYEPAASVQSFIQYDLFAVKAYDHDEVYYSITHDLYKQILSRPFTEQKDIEEFDPEAARKGIRPVAPPSITSFSVDTVSAGTGMLLTINGSNFGIIRGSGKVGFKNSDYGDGRYYYPPITESYKSWSNSKIEVVVPTKAGTGIIQVITDFGDKGESTKALYVTYAHSNVLYFSSTVDTALYETQHVNSNGLGGITWQMTDQFSGKTNAVNSFYRSLETWRCGTHINWHVGEDTSLDQTARDDVNIVRFDDLSANKLGVCWSRWSGCYNNQTSTYHWYVVELDIEFDSTYNWYFGTNSPSSNQMDFQSVASHELGHGHQLSHVRDNSKMMHFSIGAGDRKSDLQLYDVEGGDYVMDKSTTDAICNEGKMTALTLSNCNITLPEAEFSVNDSVICVGDSITFTNLTAGSNLNFNWDFDDLKTASTEGPHKIAYSTHGSKTVSMIVENSFGKDTATKTITVLPPAPKMPEPFVKKDTACLGVNYYTVDSVENANNYAWNATGGSFDGSSVGRSVKINWTSGGEKTVSVVALGECGNSDKLIDTVFVLEEVTADFSYSAEGLVVDFTNGSSEASDYKWYFGNGDSSMDENPSYQYGDKGNYKVKLVSANDCHKDSLELDVNVDFRAGVDNPLTGWNIVPNPAQSESEITFNGPKVDAYQIIDMQGKVVASGMIITNTVKLPKLAEGLYVVRLQRSNSSSSVKLLISDE